VEDIYVAIRALGAAHIYDTIHSLIASMVRIDG